MGEILSPSGLETYDYGTPGWSDIESSNFQKLNNYLAKFEDLWNSTPDNWNILRYDSSTSKWIKDTIANLSSQLEDYLAKKDLSNARIAKKTITSDYTTTESDCYIFADASSGNISITLTTIEGQELMIKKTDSSSNTVTIIPSSGNIEGNSSLTLSSQYEYYRLYCDGTNWWKV